MAQEFPTGPGEDDEPWEVKCNGTFATREAIEDDEEVIAVVRLRKTGIFHNEKGKVWVAGHKTQIVSGYIVDNEADADRMADEIAERHAKDPDEIESDEIETDMDGDGDE